VGVLKNLGKIGGMVTGRVLGAPFKIAGDVVGSKYIFDIGQDISKVTSSTGELLGEVSSSATDIVIGAATRDKDKLYEGVADISTAGAKTAKGVISGSRYTLNNGKELVEGVLELNGDKIKRASGRMAKTAIVASVAVGIADFVGDGMIDDENNDSVVATQRETIESITGNDIPEAAFAGDTESGGSHESDTEKGYAVLYGEPNLDAELWHQQVYPDTCAVVSQEFILESYIDQDFSEEELANEAMSKGYYKPGFGTYPDQVGSLLEDYGIEIERSDGHTIEDIADRLSKDQKIIVSVDSNELYAPSDEEQLKDLLYIPQANHAVMVTGYDSSTQTVYLNDPDHPEGAGIKVGLEDFENAWDDSFNFMVNTVNAPSMSSV
jgi:uncharacterized protein YvpB